MKNIVWAIVLFAFAVILLYFAKEEKKRVDGLLTRGYEVEAEVVENRKRGKLYYSVFTYSYKGKTYNELSGYGSNPAIMYSIGDKVVGIVDPENPSQIEIKSFLNQKAKPVILGLLGLFCAFLAVELSFGFFRRRLK